MPDRGQAGRRLADHDAAVGVCHHDGRSSLACRCWRTAAEISHLFPPGGQGRLPARRCGWWSERWLVWQSGEWWPGWWRGWFGQAKDRSFPRHRNTWRVGVDVAGDWLGQVGDDRFTAGAVGLPQRAGPDDPRVVTHFGQRGPAPGAPVSPPMSNVRWTR
ncbi:MAG: hypothetical protein ACRDST_12210, partial [Pseudonocardiaceae bacterium]